MSKPPLGSANTDYSIDVTSFRDGKLSIEQQIEIYGTFKTKKNETYMLYFKTK
jgi:hypothetical protein